MKAGRLGYAAADLDLGPEPMTESVPAGGPSLSSAAPVDGSFHV